MEKRDLIDMIVTVLVLLVLFVMNVYQSYKLGVKQNRINELEQKVEEQYYLIDALQQ